MRLPIISLLFFAAGPVLYLQGLAHQHWIDQQNERLARASAADLVSLRVMQMAKSFAGAEPSYEVTFNALNPSQKIQFVREGTVYERDADYGGLPIDTGYEFVGAYCSGCHSLDIVMQQRASSQRWEYMLDWMTEEQNMPALEGPDRERTVRYLSKHFGN